MPRTRGGGVGRVGGSEGERIRPTASVRRQRRDDVSQPDPAEMQDILQPDIHDGGDQRHEEGLAAEDVGFAGGPSDLSLLTSYANHVAVAIWDGEDRRALKVVSHGKNLNETRAPEGEVLAIILNSGLGPLMQCSHTIIDRGLISSFAERWHKETSSFHLLIGEMTVTLDDVSSLLHLPITGEFVCTEPVGKDAAVELLHELLGVSVAEARTEIEQTRSGIVRLHWLEDLYHRACDDGQVDVAARAYLFRLLGCTLFADKSATAVGVGYLEVFRDLAGLHRFAWGASGLAYMYDQLSDASSRTTKQMAGYMTLLQAWILEHFPHIGTRQLRVDFTTQMPVAMRQGAVRASGDLVPYRRMLDRIRSDEVCWMPYTTYREHRPFAESSWYSGCIRAGGLMYLHLPERVLRQYGHMQGIPRSPPMDTLAAMYDDPHLLDDMFAAVMDHVLPLADRGAPSSTGDCVAGYIDWFRRVSHPYMLPSSIVEPSSIPLHSTTIPTESTLSDVAQLTHALDDRQRHLQRASELLQQLIDLRIVTEGTSGHDIASEALTCVRLAMDGTITYERRKRGRR